MTIPLATESIAPLWAEIVTCAIPCFRGSSIVDWEPLYVSVKVIIVPSGTAFLLQSRTASRNHVNLLTCRLCVHLQPARIAWNLLYDARVGNLTNSGQELIHALLRRRVHFCPGSSVPCGHNAFLNSARWARKFKRQWHRFRNQIVIGIEDIDSACDPIVQANRKPRRLREKTQVRRFACGHNFE